ncbi:hypothetical protein D3C73_784610 [compost metagenome]
MPSATGILFINLKTLPLPSLALFFSVGMLNINHAAAMTATGTMQKNAPRQPINEPTKLPSGAAITVARALPPLTMAMARVTWSSGTRRMAVAADNDQKPPMAMPIKARANM